MTTPSTARPPTRVRPRCGPRRRASSLPRTAASGPSGWRRRRSRRWGRTRTSTTSSSTRSSSACTPRWVRRRSRTTSGCRASSSPTRWHCCSRSARAGSRGRRGRGVVGEVRRERHPAQRRARHPARGRAWHPARRPAPPMARPPVRARWRRTVHWPRSARAQHPRGGVLVEDRHPARDDPPGPQEGVRWSGARGGDERAGARAGRPHPPVVRRPTVTRGAKPRSTVGSSPRRLDARRVFSPLDERRGGG